MGDDLVSLFIVKVLNYKNLLDIVHAYETTLTAKTLSCVSETFRLAQEMAPQLG